MKQLPLAALFGTSLLCLNISPPVAAEETDTLDNIVVTADRKARTVDETLAPVTIITRKDIEQYQATDLVEVLRRVPGVTLINSGGVGQTTSVSIRGTNAQHVLVLVDGVKIGSATLGTTAFEHIPLDQVERVEIVRGPRSSLYGSEAIGGVIQIFTRKGGKGFQPEISISTGSHDTQKLDVNLAGGDKNTWYNVNVGSGKTDGISTCKVAAACFLPALQPDQDSYRRETASFRAGHRFGENTSVEVSGLQAKGDAHFDGTQQNQSDFLQQVLSGTVKHHLGDKTTLRAEFGQSLDKSDNFLNSAFVSRFDTKRETSSLQLDRQIGENGSVTLGMDQTRDRVSTSDLLNWTPVNEQYAETSRRNTGTFASFQTRFGQNSLDVSARHDDNQKSGKHNTGSIALGHEMANGLRVKASYGTAFKAPTFNDQYYPDDGFNVGNPNIRPELSKNTELGLQGKLGQQGSWEVNAFQNRIDDMISWQPVLPGGRWTPVNVNKANIRGLEMSANSKLAGWDVKGSVTLQSPKDSQSGNLLIYRPKRFASLDVDRDFGRFHTGATVTAESERYGSPANAAANRVGGYATLDLRADYKLSKDWALGAKVGNVLDKDYETNRGYNQDGINGLVTLKYAPK
jgi:vitamin B12 transporter